MVTAQHSSLTFLRSEEPGSSPVSLTLLSGTSQVLSPLAFFVRGPQQSSIAEFSVGGSLGYSLLGAVFLEMHSGAWLVTILSAFEFDSIGSDLRY
jgi:hypothetical protein